MCKVLKVGRSSYYRWYSGDISNRKLENFELTVAIKEIFTQSNNTYGSPRISAELKRRGHSASKPRVAKLMRLNGLKSKIRKRYRVTTTNSNHKLAISANHLNRNFIPAALNKAWVSDITYIRTNQGWLYLTTILDLFDRQIIGWSLSETMLTKETIIPAWKMAVNKREIDDQLIFHSDRGVQYASKEFRRYLNSKPLITQSMSRKGNCWDNAVAESFFKTLKVELIYHQEYTTIQQAKLAVFEYIEVWYNRKRLHSSLGYNTPVEIELKFNQLKNVA